MEGAVALDPAGIQRADLGGMPSPTTTSSPFPLFHAPTKEARHCYSNQPGWGLEWKVMERTRDLQPELPPAAGLGRQWEAEPSSVYPGYALPEQMGACHCCQPGTGLTPSYCQVASDLRAWRGACLVWLFTRASLSGWKLSAHLSEHSLQGAWDTGHIMDSDPKRPSLCSSGWELAAWGTLDSQKHYGVLQYQVATSELDSPLNTIEIISQF